MTGRPGADTARVMLNWASEIGGFWFDHKTAFERSLAFGDDALHPIVGVLLLLVLAALLRRPLASWLPWLALFGLELLNEWADLTGEVWPDRDNQWGESAKDVLLTMLLPTVLLLAARWRPGLLIRERDNPDKGG